MKKLTIIFVAIFSVMAMAAQKPCSEVFPNAGIKATLGVDGSRCVVSKVKKENYNETMKIMVSEDNSTITVMLNSSKTNNGEKETNTGFLNCEDVGAGQRFECEGYHETNGNRSPDKGIYNLAFIKNLFVGTSTNDIHYLFGGPAPWEMGY